MQSGTDYYERDHANSTIEAICSSVREGKISGNLVLSGYLQTGWYADEHVEMLAAALKWNRSIESLKLEYTLIGDYGVGVLDRLLRSGTTAIKYLSLGHNYFISSNGKRVLANLEKDRVIVNLSNYTDNIGPSIDDIDYW